MIRAVVFDVGETLVDETRSWAGWADHMGVPHFTFFAAMGIVVARGWHHRRVFDLVRPGFDHEAAAAERRADRGTAREEGAVAMDRFEASAKRRAIRKSPGSIGENHGDVHRYLPFAAVL